MESVPQRTVFNAFGNQQITPMGVCKFTTVFENRTITINAYVFSDNKSNYDLIIGNAFSRKRSANINFDGLAYSILADDGHLITIPGSIGKTRLNISDLQFHLVCSKKHFINPMSVHQISVILKKVGDETQYYFDNPIQFYVEAN